MQQPSEDTLAKKTEGYVKNDECPVCLHHIDCATLGTNVVHGPKPVGPRPGDVSLCMYCLSVLRFDKDMNLYSPSEDEILEIDVAGELQRMRTTIKLFKQQFPEYFSPAE